MSTTAESDRVFEDAVRALRVEGKVTVRGKECEATTVVGAAMKAGARHVVNDFIQTVLLPQICRDDTRRLLGGDSKTIPHA